MAGTAGYFGYKYVNLSNDTDTLMAAASEGLYEEAIATVTRKINRVKDRIDTISEYLNSNPNDNQSNRILIEYKSKLLVLDNRKRRFIDAQRIYELNCE